MQVSNGVCSKFTILPFQPLPHLSTLLFLWRGGSGLRWRLPVTCQRVPRSPLEQDDAPSPSPSNRSKLPKIFSSQFRKFWFFCSVLLMLTWSRTPLTAARNPSLSCLPSASSSTAFLLREELLVVPFRDSLPLIASPDWLSCWWSLLVIASSCSFHFHGIPAIQVSILSFSIVNVDNFVCTTVVSIIGMEWLPQFADSRNVSFQFQVLLRRNGERGHWPMRISSDELADWVSFRPCKCYWRMIMFCFFLMIMKWLKTSYLSVVFKHALLFFIWRFVFELQF